MPSSFIALLSTSPKYSLCLHNFLQNYIPNDGDVMVRIAFAESVADLATTAHR